MRRIHRITDKNVKNQEQFTTTHEIKKDSRKKRKNITAFYFVVLACASLHVALYHYTIRPSNEHGNFVAVENNKDISYENDIERFQFYKILDRPSIIVLEQYKLIWFLNPKVASTSTRVTLARLLNQQVDRINTNYTHIRNFTFLHTYSINQIKEFLISPDWIRAIILRDPKERLLSAYLDKEKKYWEGVNISFDNVVIMNLLE